jgi:signal transduction histidine kinase
MIQRELRVLVLGEMPEVRGVFERELFETRYPTRVSWAEEVDEFREELEEDQAYDLIIMKLMPAGFDILERVRDHWPATPVLALVELDEIEHLVEAESRGLEDYVVRVGEPKLVVELMAEKIRLQWKRFVEPPSMEQPTAGEVYRYAQFYNILQPFVLVSRGRRLLYLNRAAQSLIENLHGYTASVGDPIAEWWLDRSLDVFEERLARGFAGHQNVARRDFEGDGEDPHLHELYYQPVVDPSGRVVAVSVAVHEAARPELQRVRTRQAVSEFAGGVAHQNNNLLNILSANIELLGERLEEFDDEPARDYLERLRRSTERAADFTFQLQIFSRTSVTKPSEVQFDELLEEMHDELAETAGGGVELVFVLDGDLPTVRGDRRQFETMLQTLVRNASEAIDGEGVVEFRAESRCVSYREAGTPVPEGLYLVLEVSDTGEGIAPDHRDRIFEPFYTTRRHDDHVGLGLAIVETIVEQSGGEITFETELGEGTTFRIFLPTVMTREAHGRVAETEPSDAAPGESGAQPETILLVEDEADLRGSFRELLEMEGYRVLEASDLGGAVEMFDQHVGQGESIDLVVADVELPDGRGTGLAERLEEGAPAPPFVFVSGYGESVREEIDQPDSVRCTFLTKPLQIETLLTAIRNFLPSTDA